MNRRRKIARLKLSFGLLTIGLLLLGIIVTLGLKDKVTQFFSEATGTKAEIIVDAQAGLGALPTPWRNLAQGGEEPGALPKLVAKVKPLQADYIRLDHVFDFYDVAKKETGQIHFNWTKLDQEINAITQSGAKPLIALSYLPSGFGADITAVPDNWSDWYALVKATIEHYSGTQGMNIDGIYYEVWNEPDLFGGWKTRGDKNYLQLYRVAAQAAAEVKNTQPFKLGGPATTGAYPAWIEALLNLVDQENLRLDFISWHRYSWDADALTDDVHLINRLLADHPRLALKEKLLTEWGPDPQNHPAYDNQLGASHLMVNIRSMLGIIHKAFLFEIMDGADPNNQTFWGRYGLLTHHRFDLQAKPRYRLWLWLNELEGERYKVSGEGSWVKGFAFKTNQQLHLYLVNYDPNLNHLETVPVVVNGLIPGNYETRWEWFEGKTTTKTITITAGTFADQVMLRPNEVVRLKLIPL